MTAEAKIENDLLKRLFRFLFTKIITNKMTKTQTLNNSDDIGLCEIISI